MKKIFFALILLQSALQSQPIDTNVFKYFPLSVGNRWTWYVDQYWNPGPGYEVMKIQSAQIVNNHAYYLASIDYYYIYGGHTAGYDLYRIDSTTGNLFTYDQLNHIDCLSDSLNSAIGDSAYDACRNRWNKFDTSSYGIFGSVQSVKYFGWSNYFEAGGWRDFAPNYGRVYETQAFHSITTFWYLRGCLINGILHGDTSVLVGIQNISSEVPKSFSLSQNYPNPFNPKTVIRFQVASDKFVALKIFDALGREVETLVNEQLHPGTYEVYWNRTNAASGIYYYRLQSENFVDIKKMVLLK